MRWDFQELLGLDLNDWLRGERHWADFWELMEQLPEEGAYRSALLEDRDLAEQVLASEDAQRTEPGPLSLRRYGPIARKLDDLTDAVFQLAAITGHAKPSDAPSVERPKPEIDYARSELVSDNLGIFVAYLLR